MKLRIKAGILACLMICSLFISTLPTVFAYEGTPEFIRIGLYYASTAKESVNITSTGGISLLVTDDTQSIPLCADESVSKVLVKRDDCYHAELRQAFDTYEEAWEMKSALMKEGYPAFTAYRGGNYRVWIGVCSGKSEAQESAGGLDVQILPPNEKSVLVYIGDAVWMGVADDTMHLTVAPIDGTLAVEGTGYRGSVQFMRHTTGDMTVVNVVDFDDYLCGVVPREVSASWNYEVVKAQAVVSRTFAITNLNKYKKYGFNLDATTNSQAYAGIKIEHEASNRAVKETHGEVVLYNGKPANVYFFASSGGKTGTAKDAWGGDDQPYLKSIDDPYENPEKATRARWEMRFTADELKEKLAAKDVHIGDITNVTVEYSSSGSGRVIRTVFHGTNGTKEYLRENVRWVLGVYSAAFSVSRSGEAPKVKLSLSELTKSISKMPAANRSILGSISASGAITVKTVDTIQSLSGNAEGSGDFIFTGRGWGHGVGMSQWGAKGMAEAGFGYKEIIEYYFTGTQVG
ncbi:MAG: SpoIID/LytB domain-containing protein [Clostridia bacterium]|nr:SpoIID/LytB domain-containing protein [Clostridia bacterium]